MQILLDGFLAYIGVFLGSLFIYPLILGVFIICITIMIKWRERSDAKKRRKAESEGRIPEGQESQGVPDLHEDNR